MFSIVRVLPDGSLDTSLNPTASQPGVEQVPALGLAHPGGVLVGLRDLRVQQRAVQGRDGAFCPGNRPQAGHLADGV